MNSSSLSLFWLECHLHIAFTSSTLQNIILNYIRKSLQVKHKIIIPAGRIHLHFHNLLFVEKNNHCIYKEETHANYIL